MKKAKEYAADIIAAYVETDEKGALKVAVDVLGSLFTEMQELSKVRKATTDEAGISIIKEQHRKWVAICSRVNKEVLLMKEDALLEFLKAKNSPIYNAVMQKMSV
jgi:hypothetical protein